MSNMLAFTGGLTNGENAPDTILASEGLSIQGETINGLAGNDVIFGDHAPVTFDAGDENNTAETAFDLDATHLWSTLENPDVGNTSIPYTTVLGKGTGAPNYFKVTVPEGSSLTIDLDYGNSPFGGIAFRNIIVSDTAGVTFMSSRNSTLGGRGSVGSTSTTDAANDHHVQWTNSTGASKTVTFHVGDPTSADGNIPNHATYMINISVPNHAWTQPTPDNDVLDGGEGDDVVYGGGGDDFVIASRGADHYDGGSGDYDQLDFRKADGGVAISMLTTDPRIPAQTGWAEGKTVTGFEVLFGSTFGDTLGGDGKRNVIYGEQGDDTIFGNGSDDPEDGDDLWGGFGDDTIHGGREGDALFGEIGDDTLVIVANPGFPSSINGGSGRDLLDASAVADSLYFNASQNVVTFFSVETPLDMQNLYLVEDVIGTGLADEILGDEASNNFVGGGGSDKVAGGAGNDFIVGGAGDDALDGNLDNDTILGGAGSDYILASLGNDSINGGDGNDILVYSPTINLMPGDYTLPVLERLSVDLVTGVASFYAPETGFSHRNELASVENVGGSNANDVMRGDSADNQMPGYHGDDRIEGRGGGDFLNGSLGNDVLFGDNAAGSGMDLFYMNAGDETQQYLRSDGAFAMPAGLNSMTVEFMVHASEKFDEFSPRAELLRYATDAFGDGMIIAGDGRPDDEIFFYFGATAHTANVKTAELLDGGAHRLSISKDADAGFYKVYFDGVLRDTILSSGAARAIDQGGDLVMGQWLKTPSTPIETISPFSGGVGDIRFFSDVRTDAEIAVNWNKPLAATSDPALFAYFKMDAAAGTITDAKGGNDLMIMGGATAAQIKSFGADGDDVLFGDEGIDWLIGGGGNDDLDGWTNPTDFGDVMLGGAGNDTYHVDSPLDLVDEGIVFPQFGFGGVDTIVSTADFYWDFYSAGDVLQIAETAVDPGNDGTTLVGSVFSGFLLGNSGTNVLFGRGGGDVYIAGDGIDFISLSTLGLTDANAYAGVDGVNTVIVQQRASGPVSYDIVFEFESSKDKIDVSSYATVNGLTTGAQVLARVVNDGAGNSYIPLGDGLDYVYMVGLEKAELSASDFIV